jgi:hypothetical protein
MHKSLAKRLNFSRETLRFMSGLRKLRHVVDGTTDEAENDPK